MTDGKGAGCGSRGGVLGSIDGRGSRGFSSADAAVFRAASTSCKGAGCHYGHLSVSVFLRVGPFTGAGRSAGPGGVV